MVNIKVGDKVVDKTTGKHGTVHSFIRPYTFGYAPKVKAHLILDNGNTLDVEPHNLALEEGYTAPVFDPVGVNDMKDPNDKAESLTPATPKRGRKSKTETKLDEIIESAN